MQQVRRSGARARSTAVAAIATAMAVLTGCVAAPPASDDDASALDRFHRQELSWGSCADYATNADETELYEVVADAECARLAVPLDYDEPSGAEASVAVLRVPARGDSLGPLVINPGGPGGSGLIGAISTAAGLVESEITERFDVVGFDPRGVGATRPAADCYSDEQADAGSVPLGASGTTARFTEDGTRAILERCAEGSGGVDALLSMGTRDTARDMDVLRAALDQRQLTFLGQSYGTRLGAVYAEQFPERVRAMLLDGPRDPRETTFETRVGAYAGFQSAFDAMAETCTAEPGCPLGQDAALATERFQGIVQPLLEQPVPALGTELGFDDAVGGVIAGLYATEAWPRVLAGIAEVREGRGDGLLQLVRDFAPRASDGVWPNANEANHAINCMDEQRYTPEEGAELRAATYQRAPFMDPGVDMSEGARDGCEHWPAEPTLGVPYAQGVEGLPQTLVVALTDDPTTPYPGGVGLAESLGSALLTVEGQGHTIVAGGRNACVDAIAADYLIALETPPEGATCSM